MSSVGSTVGLDLPTLAQLGLLTVALTSPLLWRGRGVLINTTVILSIRIPRKINKSIKLKSLFSMAFYLGPAIP